MDGNNIIILPQIAQWTFSILEKCWFFANVIWFHAEHNIVSHLSLHYYLHKNEFKTNINFQVFSTFLCELYHTLKGVIFSLLRPDLLLSISSAIVALNSVSVISRCSIGTNPSSKQDFAIPIMFLAACTSRFSWYPQLQTYILSASVISFFTEWHLGHSFVVGINLSRTTV